MDFFIRKFRQNDFFWLKDYDCHPLNIERDSIYLFFAVHFQNFSFVAINTEDETPVGFLLGFLPSNKDEAYIHYLFVNKQFRFNKIATLMVKKFEDSVFKSGGKYVNLYTARAEKFYNKMGYQNSNVIFESDIETYINEIKKVQIMRKKLNG